MLGTFTVVGDLRAMLPTIQFDGEAGFRAEKIQDVAIYGVLTPEFESEQIPTPQQMPEQAFGISLAFS
jgi:hypothetical protein